MDLIQALEAEDIGEGRFEIKLRYSTYGLVGDRGRDLIEASNASLIDALVSSIDNGRTDNIETLMIENIGRDRYQIFLRMNNNGSANEGNNLAVDYCVNLLTTTIQHLDSECEVYQIRDGQFNNVPRNRNLGKGPRREQ